LKPFVDAVLRVGLTLAVCAGSIGAAIVAFPLADYRSIDEDAVRDETVAVLSRSTRQTTAAAVELKWSESRQTTVGDAAGKVTDVSISASVPLECGAPVVAIDGAYRLAMCGPVPPWRDVTANTKGPDADQLAELLVGLGVLSDQDRSNGGRRAAAWKELARLVGLPAQSVFRPSDVIWIGHRTTPTLVRVQIGDEAENNTVLFDVDAVLETATVQASNGQVVTTDDRVFSVDGSTDEFPISAGGTIDSQTFETVARSTVTDPDAALPTRIQGIIRLSSPVSYAAIPPSALITAPDGSNCVLLAEGGTTAVTVIESVTGLTMVDADLVEGTVIRDYPPAGATC